MIQWKRIRVCDRDFIFFRNSLYLAIYDKEFEKALILAAEGNNESNNRYFDMAKNLLQQDDLFREKIMIKGLNSANHNFPKLMGMQINTVNACNMECGYCFAEGGNHNRDYIMNEDLADKSIDFLFNNAGAAQTLSITIIGGEPFINTDVFEHLIHYAVHKAQEHGKKIRFFTTTNGTILNEKIKTLINKYQFNVLLSLDSHIPEIQNYLRPMKNGQGSWEHIMEENWEFYRNRHKSAVHITLTPYNYKLFDYARFCYDSGFYCVHFNLVRSNNKKYIFSKKQLKLILAECDKLAQYLVDEISGGKEKFASPIMDNIWRIYNRLPQISKCSTPGGHCIVAPDGEVYPCDVLMWEEYCLGSIYENEFTINKGIEPSENKKCHECWARYLCGGLCYAEKIENNSWSYQETYCLYKQHICRLQLYVFFELSRNSDFIEKYVEKKRKEYNNEI